MTRRRYAPMALAVLFVILFLAQAADARLSNRWNRRLVDEGGSHIQEGSCPDHFRVGVGPEHRAIELTFQAPKDEGDGYGASTLPSTIQSVFLVRLDEFDQLPLNAFSGECYSTTYDVGNVNADPAFHDDLQQLSTPTWSVYGDATWSSSDRQIVIPQLTGSSTLTVTDLEPGVYIMGIWWEGANLEVDVNLSSQAQVFTRDRWNDGSPDNTWCPDNYLVRLDEGGGQIALSFFAGEDYPVSIDNIVVVRADRLRQLPWWSSCPWPAYNFTDPDSREHYLETFEEPVDRADWYFRRAGEVQGGAPGGPDDPYSSDGSLRIEPGGIASTIVKRTDPGVYYVGVWWSGADLKVASATDRIHLLDGRFEVKVDWRIFDVTGKGLGQFLTDEAAMFRMRANPRNVDLVVRLSNGCHVNNHYWVTVSGQTRANMTILVKDTVSSKTVQIRNPQGTLFSPVLNREAFDCP